MAIPHPHPYFASTYADQVAHGLINRMRCDTIVELVDHLAETRPDSAALGYADFTVSRSTSSTERVVTFRQLSDTSKSAARHLFDLNAVPLKRSKGHPCIGLLCASNIEFIIIWLALARLGCSALLLAPQLKPHAISHLCDKLETKTVFLRRGSRAEKADSLIDQGFHVFDISNSALQLPSLLQDTPAEITSGNDISDIAYYCHTSGTSSGAPKPIPQHHRQLLALLCSVDGYENTATFTTTPLYHGGLPDCLRGWSCGSMTWIFPEDVVPLTSSNICSAVELAKKGPKPIWYFSCVPFVLQMLAENKSAMTMLQSMKLVGVGGAALDLATGDALVEEGINLISRLGSAECGFLMSSHRDFKTDKAWNYLRSTSDASLLDFQPRDEGLFELVVKPSWPGKNLVNKPDGSYATSDLFKPHPQIPNAWLYHSRADSQITLINGKKFDPEPTENHIRTSSKYVRDVLVFGSGKEFAGVILFAAPGVVSETEVVEVVWPGIDGLNASSQSHARISRSAIVVVLTDDNDTPLEKSSKGTILRGKAETRYADVIQSAYSDRSKSNARPPVSSLEDLRRVIGDTICSVLGKEVDPDTDLFHQSVDSIAAVQIRTRLQSLCVSEGGPALSRSIVYDQGTVNGLVDYLHRVRNDQDLSELNRSPKVEDQIQELTKMGDNTIPKGGTGGGRTVVLTGATGFLGSHILTNLLHHANTSASPIDRIICLVRGPSPAERINATLSKYILPSSNPSHIHPLSCDLKLPNLGLSPADLDDIHENAFLFIHCAWTVNFSIPTRAFAPDMLALHNLLNTSIQSSAHCAFISSTASVSRTRVPPKKHSSIPEVISHDSSQSSLLSYGQSKWAAEQGCLKAWTRCRGAGLTNISFLPCSIIRVGQLCGNQGGVWNMSEAYPLMLSTAAITGALPDFGDKVLDWLPVEIAAEGVVDIALKNATTTFGSLPPEPPVYHVLNGHTTPTWSQMIRWIQETSTGKDLQVLQPEKWIMELQDRLKGMPTHPSVALFGLWEQEIAKGSSKAPIFDMENSYRISSCLESLEPLDKARVLAIWEWVHRESLRMCGMTNGLVSSETKDECSY